MLPPENLQRSGTTSSIGSSKLLLVEGKTSLEFFKAYLRYLKLHGDIETRDFGGIGDFGTYLRTLQATSGFHEVETLAIVRDAELNAQDALQSVRNHLLNRGLPTPSAHGQFTQGTPRVGVFILPDGSNPGMLETICMQSVNDDPVMPCLNTYFDCLHDLDSSSSKTAKARAHAYIASKPRSDLLVGQAAHAGYWNWQSNAFVPLNEFLSQL
jgi:hypothetical protein